MYGVPITPKEPSKPAKPRTDWKGKFEAREKEIRILIEKNRGLENTLDLVSKKYAIIEEYIDVFTRTHLQGHWHKTKCHSANRKTLLIFDGLFKGKTGYSWINKHVKECTNEICMEYKEGSP